MCAKYFVKIRAGCASFHFYSPPTFHLHPIICPSLCVDWRQTSLGKALEGPIETPSCLPPCPSPLLTRPVRDFNCRAWSTHSLFFSTPQTAIPHTCPRRLDLHSVPTFAFSFDTHHFSTNFSKRSVSPSTLRRRRQACCLLRSRSSKKIPAAPR